MDFAALGSRPCRVSDRLVLMPAAAVAPATGCQARTGGRAAARRRLPHHAPERIRPGKTRFAPGADKPLSVQTWLLWTLAAIASTLYTMPLPTATPTCDFIQKYQAFPFPASAEQVNSLPVHPVSLFYRVHGTVATRHRRSFLHLGRFPARWPLQSRARSPR